MTTTVDPAALTGRLLDIYRGRDAAGRPLAMPAATRAKYLRMWGVADPLGAASPVTTPLPCVHEGHTCRAPAGKEYDGRTYLRCDVGMGEAGTVCRCQCGPGKCPRYEADTTGEMPSPTTRIAVAAPLRIVPVGPEGLAKGRSGFAFNGGLVRFQDKLFTSYRTDWAGAQCHVAELNEDYSVRRSVVLPHLRHADAGYGREDPRLFVFRGRLHVAYIGVAGVSGPTNQMYARLTDDLRVEEVFSPQYHARTDWEKNWSFFEWCEELFCVYQAAPQHVVLHVRSNHAYPFAETPNPLPWAGGHLRGGAPPVRVGDRFYHWVHGRRDSDWVYNVGVTVFDARPPFKVVAQTPEPLLWADPDNKDGNYCAAVFPCGSVLEDGKWKVGMGWNDRSLKVAEWDAVAVDAALVGV